MLLLLLLLLRGSSTSSVFPALFRSRRPSIAPSQSRSWWQEIFPQVPSFCCLCASGRETPADLVCSFFFFFFLWQENSRRPRSLLRSRTLSSSAFLLRWLLTDWLRLEPFSTPSFPFRSSPSFLFLSIFLSLSPAVPFPLFLSFFLRSSSCYFFSFFSLPISSSSHHRRFPSSPVPSPLRPSSPPVTHLHPPPARLLTTNTS
jgi:hypothetical protein